MKQACPIRDGTGKLEDASGDAVLSMRVCGNCGGSGTRPLRAKEEAMEEKQERNRQERYTRKVCTFPADMVAAIGAYAAAERQRTPGVRVGFTDAVRILVAKALSAEKGR